MAPRLSLFEDHFANSASATLPAGVRMIYVVHGRLCIDGQGFNDNEAWAGEAGLELAAGEAGTTIWRWELSRGIAALPRGPGVRTAEKISAALDTLPEGELLLRGDSVAFPPGGTALAHTHQGPGIRCLLEGGIRIDTHGRSTSYGPGGAWFEAGPDSVFAQAASDRPSRFIRAMVLPQALLGKSSIRYVNEEDGGRPKSQSYRVFIDRPVSLAKEPA